jgi:hypothetical protein
LPTERFVGGAAATAPSVAAAAAAEEGAAAAAAEEGAAAADEAPTLSAAAAPEGAPAVWDMMNFGGEEAEEEDSPLENAQYVIYDYSGQIVRASTLLEGSNGLEVEVSALPGGMYVLQLQAERSIYRARFLKM